jgi:hypothetical protein
MTFNISDYIQKIKDTRDKSNPDGNIILAILNKEIPEISRDNIKINNSIIFIKNISPTKKTFIKLKKRKIIQLLAKSNIIIRDII